MGGVAVLVVGLRQVTHIFPRTTLAMSDTTAILKDLYSRLQQDMSSHVPSPCPILNQHHCHHHQGFMFPLSSSSKRTKT
jgi:hypothetical protein